MKTKYLLLTLRNLTRNKLFSVINIVGLSIGMTAALLMLLWIVNEVSYDRFFSKSDRIYRLMTNYEYKGEIKTNSSFSPDLIPVLKEKYPEIEAATGYYLHYPLITHKEHTKIYSARYINPDFFSMFDFPFVYGTAETAMPNTQSAVITESMATSVFGPEDPMGKELILDGNEVFTVTGILKDVPINTELQFQILLPFSEATRNKGAAQAPTGMIALREGVSQAEMDEKIKNFFKPYLGEAQQNMRYELFLHPIVKWHLYGNFENGNNVGGKIETVHMIAFLTAFILLIACVNFTTLSTASSEKRAREVGMRKVSGAGKAQLVVQFIGESVMLAFIAGLLAILLAHLFLPWFNTLMGTNLFMPYATTWFWLGMALFILITGCLAGCYPAFFLSSLPTLQTVKKVVKPSRINISTRKVLVVFQFSISLLLIMYTSVVNKQLKYAQDRNLGYDKEGLIYFNMRGNLTNPNTYRLFRDEMIANQVAEDVCRTNMPFTSVWGNAAPSWEGKDPEIDTPASITFCTDGKLVTFAGMEIMLGRDFEFDTYATDSSACVINESFLKMAGFTEPLGQIINIRGIELHIVGVFRDFIIESPYSPIRPMLISGKQFDDLRVMNIRFNRTLPISEAMDLTEQIFKKYNSPTPFDVHFLDEMYKRKFSNEQRTRNLSNSASILAIFISCLGLYTLAAYTAEKRTKEIAVRKVNGSTILEIIALLIRDFLYLIAIAAVIATPIAWYISRQWLNKYAYRTSLDWWLFASVILLIATIAILSVVGQAYKAAKANPVDSLNKE